MPGLIDAHTHVMFASLPQVALITSDIGFVNLAAAKTAKEMLLRGFTIIRDVGGPSLGLKRAIDMGLVQGPRIWPSGIPVAKRRRWRFPPAQRAAGATGRHVLCRSHRRRRHCG